MNKLIAYRSPWCVLTLVLIVALDRPRPAGATPPKAVAATETSAKILSKTQERGSGTTTTSVKVTIRRDPLPVIPLNISVDLDPRGLRLRPVRRLALSVGSANQGWLLNGAPLPENPKLYTIRRPDYAYGSTHMVTHLQLALAKFRAQSRYKHELIISDMSRPHGGGFGPHESHRSGRDVDIWLPRTADVPEGTPPETVQQVDWAATWTLVKTLLRTGQVKYIFLTNSRQRFLYRAALDAGFDEATLSQIIQYPHQVPTAVVRHAPNHQKHMHVRFHCAPHESRCE